MNDFFKMTIFALVTFVIGCAGSPQHQEATREETFDAKKYLTAEASGATQGEARQAALAALAAIFHSRVRAETQSRANLYVTGEEGEKFEKQVDQRVHIETDVQLQGARIGWVKPDTAAGGFQALAVLDKDQAARRWRRELERMQMEMDVGMDALKNLQGRLPRLIELNRLTGLMGLITINESRLSVLGRPSMPYDIDVTAILAERQKLLQDVAFFLQLEGEAAELFSHRLGALITSQGYRLAPSVDQAIGLISGNVWFQPLALDNPNVRFVRALADLTFIDLDTHSKLAAFSENVRKGHMDENEARRRAIDELAQQAAGKIGEELGIMGVMPAALSAE